MTNIKKAKSAKRIRIFTLGKFSSNAQLILS
jgi:hypothetical protein